MSEKQDKYSMTVKLTWNGSSGPYWLNEDNLRLLLFSDMRSKKELIEVDILEETSRGDQE